MYPPRMARRRPFDSAAFYAALDAVRESRGLTWKAVARESGVSASTLTRVGQGRRPDLDSFAALVAWAGLRAADFIESGERAAEPLAQMSLLIRQDPHLDPRSAIALDEALRAMYRRLRTTE